MEMTSRCFECLQSLTRPSRHFVVWLECNVEVVVAVRHRRPRASIGWFVIPCVLHPYIIPKCKGCHEDREKREPVIVHDDRG